MDRDFQKKKPISSHDSSSRTCRDGEYVDGKMDFNGIVKLFKSEWITKGIDASTIAFLRAAGDYMAPMKDSDKLALTNSQIRNVYGELKRIQMKGFDKSQSEFLLLKPKVAYAAKRKSDRETETGMELFKRIFDKAYVAVIQVPDDEKENAFKNLCSIMEGLIAYHKYYGGK